MEQPKINWCSQLLTSYEEVMGRERNRAMEIAATAAERRAFEIELGRRRAQQEAALADTLRYVVAGGERVRGRFSNWDLTWQGLRDQEQEINRLTAQIHQQQAAMGDARITVDHYAGEINFERVEPVTFDYSEMEARLYGHPPLAFPTWISREPYLDDFRSSREIQGSYPPKGPTELAEKFGDLLDVALQNMGVA